MRKHSHGVPRNSCNFTPVLSLVVKSDVLRFAPENTTLTVPLTPDQWSRVFGRFGNQNATILKGFHDALGNLGHVRMTLEAAKVGPVAIIVSTRIEVRENWREIPDLFLRDNAKGEFNRGMRLERQVALYDNRPSRPKALNQCEQVSASKKVDRDNARGARTGA